MVQRILEIPPVAVHLVVDFPVVRLQGSQVEFVVVDVAVFLQRQVPAALCAGWASDSLHDISVGRV